MAVSAAAFAAMHADMPGSVGIVRVVATASLGLACGIVRASSGSVVAAILLHLAYNAVSLGVGRSWFGPRGETILPAVPNPLLALALLGVLASGAVIAARRASQTRNRATDS